MKLLCLLTKANTVKWPGGKAWKIKKVCVVKYHPYDVLPVSELKKCVSLKVNQDPSDLFEALVAIDHAYSEMLKPQVRPARKYPISPWEMIHLPGGYNAVCR
jgi:hypothetical protein